MVNVKMENYKKKHIVFIQKFILISFSVQHNQIRGLPSTYSDVFSSPNKISALGKIPGHMFSKLREKT